jgi:acyl-CoA thioesterase-1
VADRYEQVTLVPFISEEVMGVDSLVQDDGIHPNVAGHRRVAESVWTYLRPLLEKMHSQAPA